jgi:hypothetical protein
MEVNWKLEKTRKVRGHIHHSHPATLYLFVESTLIVLARSLEPMIGSTPSDLQLTNGDSIRMLPMIGSADLFFKNLCESSEFDNWPVLTHGHADDIRSPAKLRPSPRHMIHNLLPSYACDRPRIENEPMRATCRALRWLRILPLRSFGPVPGRPSQLATVPPDATTT